ncbi:hypothetical protein BLD44_028485 [Mastigocladus laminosus UU774]|nr:hypothetical protein BLD44_028485 [Mastigocladus laminosus UU774]
MEAHPIEDMKSFFEQHYGLLPGTLSSADGKAKVLNNYTGLTGQQLLVDMWKYFSQVDPLFSTHYLRRLLPGCVLYGVPVVINGVRSVSEVNVIFEVYSPDDVIHVVMRRDESYREVSDSDSDMVFYSLFYTLRRFITVSNNGTLDELYELADEVVRRAS